MAESFASMTAMAAIPLLLLSVLSLLCGNDAIVVVGDARTTATDNPCNGTVTATTEECRLRAAVASPTKTVLHLTADVFLTSDIPRVTCPDLTVIGDCKTSDGGEPRRCKIDGRGQYHGFAALFEPPADPSAARFGNLTLTALELTGFVKRDVIRDSPRGVTAVSATLANRIAITDCLLTRNRANLSAGHVEDENFGAVLDFYESSVTIVNSSFLGNAGNALHATLGGLEVSGTIFRDNVLQPPVDLGKLPGFVCERCGFENNTAQVQASAVYGSRAYMTFSDCWFVNNSLTKVGARGGAVFTFMEGSTRFCHCRFEGNTVATAGGKAMIEHVYISETNLAGETAFCGERPSIGVNLAPEAVGVAQVEDSCEGCPT